MPMKVDPQSREAVLPSVPFDMDLSNDGSLLACATQSDGNLAPVIQVVSTKDGAARTGYMQLGVERGRGVAFVAGGRELVFLFQRSGDATELHRVALTSREPTELQRYAPSLNNHSIVRDRGASRFAVLGNQVEIWDAAAGKVLHVLQGANRAQPVHAAFSRDGAHLYVYGTVEGSVVRYRVDTGKEDARWAAPTPFGAQVLVTPDERYLVAAAASHRGISVYDLTSGERLDPPAGAIKLDRSSQWRPWAVAPDSRMIVTLKASLWAFRLPGFEDASPPDDIVEPSNRAQVAASAWDAPVIAFGTAADSTVRWFRLAP